MASAEADAAAAAIAAADETGTNGNDGNGNDNGTGAGVGNAASRLTLSHEALIRIQRQTEQNIFERVSVSKEQQI
jgi:hypothetical protein